MENSPTRGTYKCYMFQNTREKLFVVDDNRFWAVRFPNLNIQPQITVKLPLVSEINSNLCR